jgi:hypothetical protein
MPVSPTELVQVADGPLLALFFDGLDTALYQIDPQSQRFQQLSSAPGTLATLSASRTGEMYAVLWSTAHPTRSIPKVAKSPDREGKIPEHDSVETEGRPNGREKDKRFKFTRKLSRTRIPTGRRRVRELSWEPWPVGHYWCCQQSGL